MIEKESWIFVPGFLFLFWVRNDGESLAPIFKTGLGSSIEGATYFIGFG